jgi:predicted membrane-bound spermidine synthase
MFMGGMTLGAYLASKFKPRTHPLLVYAVIEGLIGIYSLQFHGAFVTVSGWFYQASNLNPLMLELLLWSLSAGLIFLPAVLLGATFPLMIGAMLQRYQEASGRTIATLYFVNSAGASAGVLVNGFWFVGQFGLPGSLFIAGMINLLVAAMAAMLSRVPGQAPATYRHTDPPRHYRWLILCALGTGLASFVYEVTWIRLLSLVLGSSTYAFDLMLSVFILGIAIGSGWIRRVIDQVQSPLQLLGEIQLLMAVLALLSLVAYNYSFYIMIAILDALDRTVSGYLLYQILRYGLCALVMLPAAITAGMTLPLICRLTVENGNDRYVGRMIAANTAGAMAGVLLTVHLTLPIVGLKWSLALGAMIDLALGLMLLGVARSLLVSRLRPLLAVTSFALCLSLVDLDALALVSGVYRDQQILGDEGQEILYRKDGKTASISLVKAGSTVSLATNGKVDASLVIDDTEEYSGDEPTMVLIGALPTLIRGAALKQVANIGLGSGLTSSALLANSNIEVLYNVEIEPLVFEAIKLLGDRVKPVYNDPRSRIVVDDARAFFATGERKYDAIISEPSNPWVSGASSLFTTEFYAQISKKLNEGGLFFQWVQLFEITPALVGSIYHALAANFERIVVYQIDATDVVFVAGHQDVPDPIWSDQAKVNAALVHVDIKSIADINARFIGDERALALFFSALTPDVNSDYFPVLEIQGERSLFLGQDATDLLKLARFPADVHGLFERRRSNGALSESAHFGFAVLQNMHREVFDYLISQENRIGNEAYLAGKPLTDFLLQDKCALQPDAYKAEYEKALDQLYEMTYFLDTAEMQRLVQAFRTRGCDSDESDNAWLRVISASFGGQPASAIDAIREVLVEEPFSRTIRNRVLVTLLLTNLLNSNELGGLDEFLPFVSHFDHPRIHVLIQEIARRQESKAAGLQQE